MRHTQGRNRRAGWQFPNGPHLSAISGRSPTPHIDKKTNFAPFFNFPETAGHTRDDISHACVWDKKGTVNDIGVCTKHTVKILRILKIAISRIYERGRKGPDPQIFLTAPTASVTRLVTPLREQRAKYALQRHFL